MAGGLCKGLGFRASGLLAESIVALRTWGYKRANYDCNFHIAPIPYLLSPMTLQVGFRISGLGLGA